MTLRDQNHPGARAELDVTVSLFIVPVGDGCWDWSVKTDTGSCTGTSDSRVKAEQDVMRHLDRIVSVGR
jgi:hypothetical protein